MAAERGGRCRGGGVVLHIGIAHWYRTLVSHIGIAHCRGERIVGVGWVGGD